MEDKCRAGEAACWLLKHGPGKSQMSLGKTFFLSLSGTGEETQISINKRKTHFDTFDKMLLVKMEA